MKKVLSVAVVFLLLAGCASNVRFIPIDETYKPKAKPPDQSVILHRGNISEPYKAVGVIEAQLGRRAARPELDALLLKKAREIGADAVILVEYDIDRQVYVERHHDIVGRGPWRRHVVTSHPRVAVEKTATGLAVIFVK